MGNAFYSGKINRLSTLKDAYPRLFSITTNPDFTMAQNREGDTWNLSLRRNLNDWKIKDLIALLGCLQNRLLNSQSRDRLNGGGSRERSYSVRASYNILSFNKELIDQWPWKLIWKIKLPPKFNAFSWIAINSACLTQDNRIRRSFHPANRCHICLWNAETINHLFLH